MKVIKTKTDLQKLREEKNLPECYQSFLEEEFRDLVRGLGNGTPEADFDLTEHGPMVLVEACDNLRGELLGLNPQDGGLLGASPEYVETYDVSTYEVGKVESEYLVFKAFVLASDSYGIMYYMACGTHPDKEAEAWLEEQSDCIYRKHPSARQASKLRSRLIPW